MILCSFFMCAMKNQNLTCHVIVQRLYAIVLINYVVDLTIREREREREMVEISMIPSPSDYILRSFGFSLLI